MKNRNRILATVLALVLMLCALASCGGGAPVTDPPSGNKLSAPVIQMDKGRDVTVVWNAVEGAVSYVATVNGKDLPAQTTCSLTLTEDEEYTVSVRALAADAAYHSAPSNTINISYGFNGDAVVLCFAAFSDTHISSRQRAEKLRNIMLKTAERYPIDAFLFTGDLVDAQTTDKFNVVPRMSLFAEGVALGNEDLFMPLIWCFGNHDFPTYVLEKDEYFTSAIDGNSYFFSKGTLTYDACVSILENTSSDFFSSDEWPNQSLEVPDGFRYNLVNDFSFFSVDYTHVNTDSLAFLKAQLDALVAEEPEKQIFILSHMPQNGGSQPAGFTDLMKHYPQVVYLSGHTHNTLQTHSSVVAGRGFMEFNLGPGDHGAYGINGPGSAYNSYQMKQGAIIEVDVNGRLRFTGIDYSLNEEEDGSFTSTLSEQFVVAENPMEIRSVYLSAPSATAPSALLYDSVVTTKEDERYHAPVFPENATATFTWLTLSSGKAILPTADAANVIIYYIVELKDETTGELVAIYDKQAKNYATTLKPPANHIFYPDGERMPDTWTLELKPKSPFDPSHEYVLSVKAVDDFGVASSEWIFAVTFE